MWVYFNVPEPEYLDYQINADKSNLQQVQLAMANGRLFPHIGVVETIEGEFNNETGNIAFRATFPNPDGLLRHGETGNILMTVPVQDGLIIPQKTTFEILDKKYVYVVDEENVIHSRQITIGAEMPHLYVISEGLAEEDKILLEGLRLVREKEEIHYEFVPPASAMAHLGLYAE
jgi:membrane fusion protein (multidrug efflux system)